MAETELLEGLIDELTVRVGVEARRIEPGGEGEGLANGQDAEQRVVLLDEAERLTPVDVGVPVERDDALGRDTAGQRREQRRLTGARRSHDCARSQGGPLRSTHWP